MIDTVPTEIQPDIRKATTLAWWTLGAMATVVALMGVVAGSSQAMKSAWIEDVLSLIPAMVFLVAAHFERKPATRLFPFAFHRVHSLAFLISAVALSSVGLFLLFEAVHTLVLKEHATVGPVQVLGVQMWSGWLIIGGLIYSIIPPFILGRMKLPVAQRLQDKVLHTDAMMQKADWMTALAGIGGVIGLGLGLWWADALAAAIISISIIVDGIKALRSATAELVDGAPRALKHDEEAEDAIALRQSLEARYPDAQVRLREAGRYILAEVETTAPEMQMVSLEDLWPGDPARAWRFARLSFIVRPAPLTSQVIVVP